MRPLLVARDLAISCRLERTSLEIGSGQLVALIGPNGSGKTSLLHALAGIPPASGCVSIDGQDPRGLHPDRKQRLFSFLPASRDIIWPLTARTFIELALPPGTAWYEIAERFELNPLLDRRMDRLSTGERSRVMIARSLAPDSHLLLMDEPIANLDPFWQLTILDELCSHARQSGRTVIAAIHDLRAALDWSDRLIVMDQGRCVLDGPPAELRASGKIESIFRITLGAERNVRRQAGLQSSR